MRDSEYTNPGIKSGRNGTDPDPIIDDSLQRFETNMESYEHI